MTVKGPSFPVARVSPLTFPDGMFRPPASFLAWRFWGERFFSWSFKPLVHTLRQMFCTFWVFLWVLWRWCSQLLFAFEVNLQRALCSVDLWHMAEASCKDEPLPPRRHLPLPSTSWNMLRPESLLWARLFSSLNDKVGQLSTIPNLPEIPGQSLLSQTSFSQWDFYEVLLHELTWRPQTGWK